MMNPTRFKAILLFLLVLPWAAWAIDRNVAEFADPVLEQRYRTLLEELRCVVCQNQNLADSNAELAQDLRDEVRGLLVQGKSDEEIMSFLVSRYGDFVLYRPPFKSTTYLLWIGPGVILALALGFMLYFIRRHKREAAAEGGLSDNEREKLAQVLREKDLLGK